MEFVYSNSKFKKVSAVLLLPILLSDGMEISLSICVAVDKNCLMMSLPVVCHYVGRGVNWEIVLWDCSMTCDMTLLETFCIATIN